MLRIVRSSWGKFGMIKYDEIYIAQGISQKFELISYSSAKPGA
jgi:hypothetical protein